MQPKYKWPWLWPWMYEMGWIINDNFIMTTHLEAAYRQCASHVEVREAGLNGYVEDLVVIDVEEGHSG